MRSSQTSSHDILNYGRHVVQSSVTVLTRLGHMLIKKTGRGESANTYGKIVCIRKTTCPYHDTFEYRYVASIECQLCYFLAVLDKIESLMLNFNSLYTSFPFYLDRSLLGQSRNGKFFMLDIRVHCLQEWRLLHIFIHIGSHGAYRKSRRNRSTIKDEGS